MPVLQSTATSTFSRRNYNLVGARGFVAQAGRRVLVRWVLRMGANMGRGFGDGVDKERE